MTRSLYALLALLLFLAACSQPGTFDSGPVTPTNQEEVVEAVSDFSLDLEPLLMAASEDPGIIALGQLPSGPGLPFIEPGVLQNMRHQGGALRLFAATDLPRGAYVYDSDSGTWTQAAEGDALTLTWPYDPTPYDDRPEEADATLTLDWAAGAPTTRALTSDGARVEVPTDMDVLLVADGVTAADVNLALDYYESEACGGAVLEPTRLAVNGSGTLLELENVGYSVREGEDADTVLTQGAVTLRGGADSLRFTWDVEVNGDLERESCFTRSFLPTDGELATELNAEIGGETRGLAFGFRFSDVDPLEGTLELKGGYLVLDGNPVLTFEGRLDDRNGNAVPGEGVTIEFADGSSTTLEDLLLNLQMGASALRRFGLF